MLRLGPATVIVLLLGAALATLPLLSGGTYHIYLAQLVLIFGIAAIGLNILTGYAGQLSLAHAAFMAVGAYGTTLLNKWMAGTPLWAGSEMPVWLGITAGTLGAALCGGLLAIPAIRVRGPYLAMVTIAFGWILWKVLVEWVSVTGGDLGLSSIPRVRFGGLVLDLRGLYYLVLVLFLAALALQGILIRSQFGLQIRAIKHSEMAVASVGVNVHRVKFVTFVISAAFSGFAGALFAHQQSYINPDSFQMFDSVFILLAVLFGGSGTTLGPVVGTAVLVLLPEMLHSFDKYRLMVYGVLILLTLYFMPRGVVGEVLERRKRVRAAGDAGDTLESDGGALQGLGAAPGAALCVENLSHSFGGLLALSDVTFNVGKGTVHALIGPNGAGKTTLINIVTGVYAAKRGRVMVDGVKAKYRSLDVAARFGVVRTFQNLNTFGDMTAIEHVLVGLSGRSRISLLRSLLYSKHGRKVRSRQLEEGRALLNLVGVGHLELVPASAMPYGHRRLTEIARALAARPRVLLLDEPAAGLVADEVQGVASLINKLRSLGITILLVEHNMDLVLSVSDRVTVLDHGSVIADGVPGDIWRDERVITAYLGASYVDA